MHRLCSIHKTDKEGFVVDSEEMVRIATVAARRYRRKVWWASMDDMKQEALVAVIKAKETFNPDVGVSFGAYAYRAALYAIKPMLWRASSPVSEALHKLPTLKGVHRAPIDLKMPDARTPETQVGAERWKDDVRRRLAELDPTGLGISVLLDGEPSREVAARAAVPVAEVYAATALLRRRAANDFPLWRLWEES
jgi:DNA-directed RNA polymerase specialized sigma24 family protein